MTTINNRQSPRVHLRNNAVILLLLPPAYIDATVIDLSLSGALIELNDALQLPRGAHCALRLLSENGRQLVEFSATVVRHASTRRIALKATSLSPGAHGSLQRLLDGTSRLEPMTRREVCALLRPVNPAYVHQNPAANADRQLAQYI
jgi:hypothetical protein